MNLNERIKKYIKEYYLNNIAYFSGIKYIIIIKNNNNTILIEPKDFLFQIGRRDHLRIDTTTYKKIYIKNNYEHIQFYDCNDLFNKRIMFLLFEDYQEVLGCNNFLFIFILHNPKNYLIRDKLNNIINKLSEDNIIYRYTTYSYRNEYFKEELINKINLREHKKKYYEVMTELLYNPYLQFNNGKLLNFYLLLDENFRENNI